MQRRAGVGRRADQESAKKEVGFSDNSTKLAFICDIGDPISSLEMDLLENAPSCFEGVGKKYQKFKNFGFFRGKITINLSD